MKNAIEKLLWFSPLFLIGCTTPDAASPPSLAEPARATASRAMPDSQVTIVAASGLSSATASLTVKVLGLNLSVGTGAKPRLDQFEIHLADIDIPAGVVSPDPIGLRDLKLSLAQPAKATIDHAEADAVQLSAEAPLRLDWSLLLSDGTHHALGAVQTGAVAFAVDVFRSGGATFASVHATCPGTCWSVPAIAEMHDGVVFTVAPADVTRLP